MKMPNKVNISGSDFKVTYVKDSTDVHPAHREPYFGAINFEDSEIRILKRANKFDEFGVLIHEIVHAINDKLSLDMTEEKVKAFAHDWADTLVRNKMVVL